MTEEISEELFEHLVRLAALQLDPAEARYLRDQLNKQLIAIDELQAIPVDPGTPIAAHGVPYTFETSQPVREDRWNPAEDPQRIVELAPESEDGYIVVPEIPHTEI
jgi:aspartyl/glutamyl-tRNA(Asn/Gln) amidotransferase C subunit